MFAWLHDLSQLAGALLLAGISFAVPALVWGKMHLHYGKKDMLLESRLRVYKLLFDNEILDRIKRGEK